LGQGGIFRRFRNNWRIFHVGGVDEGKGEVLIELQAANNDRRKSTLGTSILFLPAGDALVPFFTVSRRDINSKERERPNFNYSRARESLTTAHE